MVPLEHTPRNPNAAADATRAEVEELRQRNAILSALLSTARDELDAALLRNECDQALIGNLRHSNASWMRWALRLETKLFVTAQMGYKGVKSYLSRLSREQQIARAAYFTVVVHRSEAEHYRKVAATLDQARRLAADMDRVRVRGEPLAKIMAISPEGRFLTLRPSDWGPAAAPRSPAALRRAVRVSGG